MLYNINCFITFGSPISDQTFKTIDINITIHISPRLLHQLRLNNDLKVYAVWLWMKRRYRNSCIYNYSIRSLATKLKRSTTFIRKYVSIFLRCGWCRLHSGNLVFNKHSQLPEKQHNKKCLFLVTQPVMGDTIEDYLSSMKAFLVNDAQRKQQYAKANARRDKAHRVAFSEIDGWKPFTVKQASKLFTISKATGSRWLRKLADQGWYKRITIKPWLQTMNLEDLLKPDPNSKLHWAVKHYECGTTVYQTEKFSLVPFKGHVLVCYPSFINWCIAGRNPNN